MAVRLFVGNLPYDATEADLREHFSAVGPLSYVYLPTDRETGKPRGFAFIEYADRAQAEEAIRRFNNQLLKGRPIAVNEARAKEDRPRTGAPPTRSFEPRPAWGAEPSAESANPAPNPLGTSVRTLSRAARVRLPAGAAKPREDPRDL